MDNKTKTVANRFMEKLLDAGNPEAMTNGEFIAYFKQVIDFVKQIKGTTEKELETIKSLIFSTLSEIQARNKKEIDSINEELMDYCSKEMGKMMKECEAKMEAIDKKMDSVEDGKDADEEKIIEEVLAKIQLPEQKEIILDNGDQIIDKINNGSNKLIDIKAIDGIDKLINDLKSSNKSVKVGWGAHPLAIYDGTTLVDKVARVINFGTNLTASRAADGTITVNASGGGGAGFTRENPTGTVDGSNTTFTVSTQPEYLVIDGGTFFEGYGYTYLAGTITTTNPPAQFIVSYHA